MRTVNRKQFDTFVRFIGDAALNNTNVAVYKSEKTKEYIVAVESANSGRIVNNGYKVFESKESYEAWRDALDIDSDAYNKMGDFLRAASDLGIEFN